MERAPWLLIPVAVALVLRVLRLDWQPLWWDEGYSVYFAGEPLPRMLWLTAHDIHPPLYYALLHGWTALAGTLRPELLRLLSVLSGVLSVALLGWLGRLLVPARGSVAWIAAQLLAISPMHIFYSQELRMYALATACSLFATGLLWIAVARLEAQSPAGKWLVAWAFAAALSLYTLYYTALLLVAQSLWAIWRLRRLLGARLRFAGATAGALLLYLPWLVYALPKLVAYVAQKVESDQDRALGPAEYLWRHLRAFTVGHVDGGLSWRVASIVAAVAIVLLVLLFATRNTRQESAGNGRASPPSPVAALTSWLLLTIGAAFALGLRLPFFPAGGERLLLIILPHFLLLIAVMIDRAGVVGKAVVLTLAAASLLGTGIYFTTPRYQADDYRPLIRSMVQQGAPGDTMLATFPWMIGYWRAYAPAGLDGPDPVLLGEAAVEYGPEVEAAIDRALAAGTLWFPEPLGFGSDLLPRMEEYLRAHATNLENRWQSTSTRLSAWARLDAPAQASVQAIFGDVIMGAAGVTTSAPASNGKLAVAVTWQGAYDVSLHSVTLRLLDAQSRVWVARDYSPPGSFAQAASATEVVGLILPPGLPPGDYVLAVGMSARPGGRMLTAEAATLAGGTLAPIGTVHVTLPPEPPDLARLAMAPVADQSGNDLRIVGVRLPEAPVLAGTPIELELFALAPQRPSSELELYVNLIDVEGNQGEYGPEQAGDKEILITQWNAGWPLPDYPPQRWATSYPFRLPLRLDTAAWERSGAFRLEARWLALAGGWSEPVPLGTVTIERRAATFVAANLANRLEPAPLFGTHAQLAGYEIEQEGETLHLQLEWAVAQTLLPAHNIFMHLEDGSGAILAQEDGPPQTASGPAPTGSWLEGETLVTQHTVVMPAGAQGEIRVGLYEPNSLVRLPVSVNGAPAGDAVLLPLPD